jgi:outer membrane protein TolC
MALWDRVRTELDRAGRVAQQAFDEGRLRLEMLRARRQADGAAQRLGYAIYRARREVRDVTGDEYFVLARAIEIAEAEVDRYRHLVEEATARRRRGMSLQHTDPGAGPA